METTFSNVTITIEAENPKAAYTKLCEMFEAVQGLEYMTDSFTTDTEPNNDLDTSELWPKEEEE